MNLDERAPPWNSPHAPPPAQLLGDFRMVFLLGPLTEELAQTIIASMLFLDERSKVAPILLVIDSPGGRANDALAIVDAIREVACRVTSFVPFRASGAAALIAACGARPERCLGPKAMLGLTPMLSTSTEPSARPIALRELERMTDEYVKFLTEATRLEPERVRGFMTHGRSFSAKDAIAHGLADRIETPDVFRSAFGDAL